VRRDYGTIRREEEHVKKSGAQLDREIAAVAAQPRSRPGDDPELWSDQELGERLRKYRARPHAPGMSEIRKFHALMDEAIERRRAAGERGTTDEIWKRILLEHAQ
jgi:hypothetical protein